MNDKIKYKSGREKWDLQLSAALIDERRLGHIFEHLKIEKIELKTERWLWEQTGNIGIEYADGDKPTGISVTQADCWVHELLRDGETLVYLMFPIDRLKALARAAIRAKRIGVGGDSGQVKIALIALRDILRADDLQRLRITIAPRDATDAARIAAQVGGLLERGLP